MDRTLWPSILLLAAVFALFEGTGLDLWVQDHLYEFATQTWLIDKGATVSHLIFYIGPKVLLVCLGTALLLVAIFRDRFTKYHLPSRRDLMIAVLTISLAPALVAVCKATTDVYCPYQVTRYGGHIPYHKVLEGFPDDQHPTGHGRGFPAGHASGGFALVSLAGLMTGTRSRVACILMAQAAGWLMGGYQMLRGAHYLSHTLITCLLCWIVFLLLRRLIPTLPTSNQQPYPRRQVCEWEA